MLLRPFAIILLLAFSVFAQLSAGEGRPNIIFILADDLGHGHLGCYGQKQIKTPHIDRIAKEGLRFTQAYAGCTVCAPSRSVLMTGLHTGHCPVRNNGGQFVMRDEDVCIAEILTAAGYATACIGKWGQGDHGTPGEAIKQGFDEHFGYLHQTHAHFYYPEYLWENDHKFMLAGNAGGKHGQYSHDLIMGRAEDFIRRHKEQPFFLYLTPTIPHVELAVPEDSLAKYRGKFPKQLIDDPRPGYIDADDGYATYAAMISRLDDGVGRMMALLKELKIDENTIVFFSSDNGAQGTGAWEKLIAFFNGTGGLRGSKGDMYEGGIRTPLLVRWPGKIKAGGTADLPVYFADVLPTLTELTHSKLPEKVKIDGLSFVPELFGEKAAGRAQPRHDFMYWELPAGKRDLQKAVRMGNWKAVRRKNALSLELYDLSADPKETKDLAPSQPAVVEKIEAYLKTCRVDDRPPLPENLPPGKKYQ
ncbi:MAG TPA: arylsulfatase [Pirellulaceae bacterium]|nr:arylsulfatase [Pirellulaceae bacterium]